MTWLRGLSWQTKLTLLLVAFAVTPMVTVAGWTYQQLADDFEATTLENFSALARTKVAAIDQFIEGRKRDVSVMAGLVAGSLERFQATQGTLEEKKERADEAPALKDAELVGHQPQAGSRLNKKRAPEIALAPPKTALPGHAALEDLQRTLGLILWDQREFEELLVFDSNGIVVASTFVEHRGRAADELEYFTRGKAGIYIQPVFLSPITKQLTMVISGPIQDEQKRTIGVLAARLNLVRFFQLINDRSGLGKTGETVVAKMIENKLVFMAPTRHDSSASALPEPRTPKPQLVPLQEAARGQTGAGRETDYRGRLVYAAWQFIPSLEWGLVVKQETQEVLESLVHLRDVVLMTVAFIMLVVLLIAPITAMQLVRPLRQLRLATDRISRGDFDTAVEIHSRDEIGALADSFERMTAAIKFFRDTARAESALDEDGAGSGGDTAAADPADPSPNLSAGPGAAKPR